MMQSCFRPPTAAKVPRTTNNFCPTNTNNNLKNKILRLSHPTRFFCGRTASRRLFAKRTETKNLGTATHSPFPFTNHKTKGKESKQTVGLSQTPQGHKRFYPLAHFPQGLHTCNEKRNSSPPSLRFLTEIVPRWKATALRTMLKPRPVPPSARVRPRSTR